MSALSMDRLYIFSAYYAIVIFFDFSLSFLFFMYFLIILPVFRCIFMQKIFHIFQIISCIFIKSGVY